MVNAAADYKFVTDLDDLIIDGGIMPLRDDAYLLRGEDLAFLWEASQEINTLLGGSASSMSFADRRVLASRPKSIASMFKSFEGERTATASAVPDTCVLSGVSETTATSYDPWTAGFFSPILTNFSATSSASDFYSGALVEKAPIDCLFTDSQDIRAVFPYAPFTLSGATYETIGSGGPYPPSMANITYGYAVSNVFESGGWCETKIGGGNYAASLSLSPLPFTFRAYARVVTINAITTDTEEVSAYVDMISVPASLISSGFLVSAAMIGNTARSIALGHAAKVPYSPAQTRTAEYTNQLLTAEAYIAAIQLIRGSHTLY